MSEWSALGVGMVSLTITLFGYAVGCPETDLSC